MSSAICTASRSGKARRSFKDFARELPSRYSMT